MKQYMILLLVLGVLLLEKGTFHEIHAPRVAIIGGGIGGASASHFLVELLNGNLDIDLYEARIIGGRLATVKIDNCEAEAGGAVIHTKNLYMQKFVKLLGLEKNAYSGEKIGIWNGDEFVYTGSNYYVISIMKLLLRYGFEAYKIDRYVNDMIEDFGKIYEIQDAGMSFDNVSALLSVMNEEFPKLLQISSKDHFLNMGLSEKFINELVEAATVVNYGQDIDIHSFISLIALAGSSSNLWSVKGGNKGVPEHLIYRNKNVNVIPGRVRKIRNIADNSNSSQYEVTYTNKDSTDAITSNYDIVIIAVPLTQDQQFLIEFAGFPDDLIFPGKYQTTYATFVKGNLNLKYFHLQEALDLILSCNPNKTMISSIGKLDCVDTSSEEDTRPWKIFSRESIDTSLIHDMFSHVTMKKEIAWKAYPKYLTNFGNLNKFKLHDALYHVNAIEWAASAMEMSAIAGRNVAILAYDDLLRKYNFTLDKEVYESSTNKLHKVSEEL